MELTKLRQVLELMREFGVHRISLEGVSVEMGAPKVVEQPEVKEAIGEAAGRPTDDELLYWSAPQAAEEVKP